MKRHHRRWLLGALRAALNHIEELEDAFEDLQAETEEEGEEEFFAQEAQPVAKTYETIVDHARIQLTIVPADQPKVALIIKDFVEDMELPTEKIILNECAFFILAAPVRDFSGLVNAINDARRSQNHPVPPPPFIPPPSDPSLN